MTGVRSDARLPLCYAPPVRPRHAAVLALLVAAASAAAPAAHAQDFDPAGRRRHKPAPASPGPRPGPRPHPGPGAAPGPRPAPHPPANHAAEGNADKGPGTAVLVARYTGIVLAQPGAPFPLQRLAQLYRERDGNLKELVADFEKRAADPGPDHWNARVALAGIYQQDGRIDDAVRTYEAAIAERPKDPTALLALAHLLQDRSDPAGARARLDRALPLVAPADRESTLRTLMALALDLDDFEGAKGYHRELVKLSGGSLFVRGELGRELMARGEYERAEAELRELVTASAGDNRTLAPALRDLGKALAKQHKNAEAMKTLERALSIAGSGAGVRTEIFAIITELYRADGELPKLVALLEAERPNDFQRLVTLGGLYEETGQIDKALATYEKALAVSPKSIDTRLKVIHLLEAQGELEKATKQYESLIRAAPHNPDYVFELCDTLIQRGERERALRVLAELERRASGDDDVLARLADFYDRADEKQKALALLERLAQSSPNDPSHLVDLGDRYWQEGDKKRAVETWRRIKIVVTNRAKALATLGDVFLEHDMPSEALEALREASEIEPQSLPYQKSYATALERTATSIGGPALAAQRYDEARAIWEKLLARAGTDRNLAREARTHIVTLWGLLHQLETHVPELEKRLGAKPPDLEAGRLLAEVYVRLRKLPEAEAALRRVTNAAPGDEDAFLSLERVLVLEQNLSAAIDVLRKLVEIDPKRARELYQRMAQYAAELYRDDDAIRFAEKAVALSPEDAEGHRKLGEMYRKKQDAEHAIAEFRAAIAKNDRLFPVYFELAEMLLAHGEADEADRLFRRVVRASPDEELVSLAARRSIQINLGKGTLASLEQELLPVALGNPRKTIYRRLLVELYSDMAFPLIQRVRHGAPKDAATARDELVKMGTRAVKPLLDALADEKEAQQRIAIDVLSFVENKAAGPALFAFATGPADATLRVQAMVACGALRDAALLPRYEALLLPKGTAFGAGDPVAVAAAWSVARMGDKRALPLLGSLLAKGTPEVRALAAVGIAAQRERREVPELVRVARSLDAGNVARAAAAYALGDLGAKEATPALVALAEGGDTLPREAAIVALARLSAEAAPSAIAQGIVSTDPELREAAFGAAVAFDARAYHGPADPLPVPDGPLDLRAILARLSPSGHDPRAAAHAFVVLAPALRSAASAAVETSPERAAIVAEALLARGGRPAFAPFTNGLDSVDDALRAQAEAAAESIAAAVVPAFVGLERHPVTSVRVRAVEVLATRGEDEAQAAVVDALGDPDEAVQRAALGAVRSGAGSPVVRAVAALVGAAKSWPLRLRAAEALGRIGTATTESTAALAKAARGDAFALVREGALRALAAVDRDAAAPVLRDAAEKDPEPRIRTVAAALGASR